MLLVEDLIQLMSCPVHIGIQAQLLYAFSLKDRCLLTIGYLPQVKNCLAYSEIRLRNEHTKVGSDACNTETTLGHNQKVGPVDQHESFRQLERSIGRRGGCLVDIRRSGYFQTHGCHFFAWNTCSNIEQQRRITPMANARCSQRRQRNFCLSHAPQLPHSRADQLFKCLFRGSILVIGGTNIVDSLMGGTTRHCYDSLCWLEAAIVAQSLSKCQPRPLNPR